MGSRAICATSSNPAASERNFSPQAFPSAGPRDSPPGRKGPPSRRSSPRSQTARISSFCSPLPAATPCHCLMRGKKSFPSSSLRASAKSPPAKASPSATKKGPGLWPRMVTSISHSAEETQALGETWGRAAVSGLVIGLSGDLGAGKTQLAKGIARGLGITERIHSPTFTLLNQYETGRLPFFHIDLYRLETPGQIIAAGLEENFHPTGVTV